MDQNMHSPIDVSPPLHYKNFEVEMKILDVSTVKITRVSDHAYKIDAEFGLIVYNMEPFAFQ